MSIRKALGAVKDQARIGIAKVAVSGAELDVAIVRATAHDDAPADDRHAREVLRLTSSPSSRARVSACVAAVSRRLARTRDYVVAAKCLALLHRLLADGDPHFRHELSGHGVLGAMAAEFRDEAHPASWDHTAFVRALALYLDDRARFLLSLLPPPRTVRFASLDGPSSSPAPAADMAARPAHEMDAAALLARAGQLRHLIERCLACRPAGAARRSRVVLAALWPVVKDSAALYADMAAVLAALLDRFFDMEDYEDCAEAFEAHVSAARLADGLLALYAWCDHAGVARSSDLEFPEVKRVDDKFLETLEQLLRERGQAEAAQTPSPPPANAHVMDGIERDVNGIRALPAPEHYKLAPTKAAAAAVAPMGDEQIQEQGELVDLRESAEEQGNKMALALFSGDPPAPETKNGGWVAFPSEDDDDAAAITASAWQTPAAEPGWELALVETASTLSTRGTAAPGGGMDALLLQGMYDHGAAVRQQQQHAASGSASSVVLPGAGFLALPGPGVHGGGGDPFAASLAVPPPAYVQMAEMERKRELLAQEQRMWAQYRQGGMQGRTGLNGVAVGGGGSAFVANSSMPMPMAGYHGGYYHY